MISRYCERHGVELSVDHDVFATMVVATVSGFHDLMALDPEGVTSETLGLALVALWDGVTAGR